MKKLVLSALFILGPSLSFALEEAVRNVQLGNAEVMGEYGRIYQQLSVTPHDEVTEDGAFFKHFGDFTVTWTPSLWQGGEGSVRFYRERPDGRGVNFAASYSVGPSPAGRGTAAVFRMIGVDNAALRFDIVDPLSGEVLQSHGPAILSLSEGEERLLAGWGIAQR